MIHNIYYGQKVYEYHADCCLITKQVMYQSLFATMSGNKIVYFTVALSYQFFCLQKCLAPWILNKSGNWLVSGEDASKQLSFVTTNTN